MCGITAVLLAGQDSAEGIPGGLLRPGYRVSARDWALHASKCLTHRGPDWSGCWPSSADGDLESPVAFGHTRLAIVKPETGAQPIVRKNDADDSITNVLVVNGEIYNYTTLLSTTLKDFTDEVRSDCEVISMLYEHYGDFEKVRFILSSPPACISSAGRRGKLQNSICQKKRKRRNSFPLSFHSLCTADPSPQSVSTPTEKTMPILP